MGSWTITGTNANAGVFIGNPSSDGMGTTGIGTTAFGLFGNSTTSGYVNATRSFDNALGVGDTFSFYWAINWDSGNSTGGKGFDLRSGGTTIFNVNNGDNAGISIGGVTPTVFNSSSFGTTPMLVTVAITTNGFTFTMSTRTNSSVSYTTNVVTSSTITGFNLYAGNQQGGGQRNPYYDDFLSTNSGVFSQGGTVTNANTFSGSGALSIGNNTTLVLSGGGNNNYTGATTISNGSTLIFAGSGTSAFASTIGGGTGNVVVSNASGTVVLTNNNTYTGNTTVAAGTLRIGHANAMGSTGTLAVNTTGQLQLSNNISINRAITLSGDGVGFSGALRNISGTNAWQGTISNASGARINADAGLLTLSNINSGTNNLYFGGAGNITVGGLIAGTQTGGNGALFKDGAGTLTLTNNNTGLTGLVRLLGGTISITNNNSLGSGTLEIGGLGTQAVLLVGTNTSRSANILVQNASTNSVVNVAAGSTFTVTGSLTQDGALANTTKFGKSGAGTLVLAGASGNTYNGQIQIGEGTVIAGTASALGVNNSTANRGIDLGLNITDVSQSNNVAVLASNGVTISNSFYVAPNTSGALRTIGLAGSGSATFNNEFYMDGILTVDAGASASDSVTMSGNVVNTGGISKTNAGILVLSGSGNTFSGGVTLGQGTLRVGANNALGTGAFTINGGTFASSSSAARTVTNNITMGGNASLGDATGTGALTLSNINLAGTTRTFTVGNNTTVAGVISNGSGTPGLTKAGSGTLTLSGSNTYSGITTINAGVLSVGAASGLGANPGAATATQVTLNGGTLATTAGMTLGNRGITVSSSSGIDVTTGGLTNTAGLFGSAALAKTGAGTLALTNTSGSYNGTITVSAGTLQANTSTSLSSANVTVGGTGTLMGSSTLGAVVVNSGGTISPGNSPGTLAVSELTLNGGGSYAWEITNADEGLAGTGWDVITVGGGSGTVTLGATSLSQFTIRIIGSSPTNWDSTVTRNYDIITAGAWNSSLDLSAFTINTSQFSAPGTLGTWGLTNNGNNLRLTYTAPAQIYDITIAANTTGTQSAPGGSNQLTGVGAVVNKLGAGTLVMTNTDNSYTGATTVKEGTLEIGAAVPASGNSLLGTGTTVTVGDTTNNVAAAFNIAAAVENARDISFVAGTGTAGRTLSTTIGSGTATQAGAVIMSTNAAFSAASGGTLNVSGNISGGGNATITNSGTTIFSGNNTYSGTTTVGSNSTLVAASSTALGGAGTTTVNNGGTLSLSNNISEDEAITISGAGVGGAGALRSISGDNTNTGTISLGSLTNVIAAATGSTLTLSNIDTVATSNNLTVSANGTVRVLGSILTAGSITNVLQKDGAGALVISNNGTTGGIQLQVGNGSVTLAAGSFSTNTSTVGSAVSPRAIDLGISATGDSVNNAAFYANSGVTVSNSFYVAPNVSSATRTLGTESGSGTATFTSEIFLGGTAQLSAASGGTALFSGNFVNNGNLVKVGDGTVRLAGNNTIGDVTISNGTLAITNGSAIPATSLLTIESLGTLSVLSTENIGRIAGTGLITVASGQTLTNTITNSASFGGQFQGAGVIRKAGVGSLTLTGSTSNSISRFEHEEGVLLIGTNTGIASVYQVQFDSPGTRTIAASGANSFTVSQSNNIFNDLTLGQASGNTGKLTFSGGTYLGDELNQTRTLTVAANNNHEFSGSITGNRGIIKEGTGTLTLSGNNTFGNTFQLNDGTVLIGNNNAFGAGVLQIHFNVGGNRTIASVSDAAYTVTNNVNVFNDVALGLSSGGIGALNFGGTFYLGDEPNQTRVITTAAGTSHTISGAVTGIRGIVKQGTGSLTLSGSNTSTGSLFVDAGGINLNGGTLASTSIEIGGGSAGSAVNSNNATLRVTAGSFTNRITVNSETNGSGVSGNRSIEFANSTGSATLSGPITAEKTFAANVIESAGTGVLSGNISGAGGLTKGGSGSLVLSGSNSFAGNISISNGTLAVTNGNAISSGSLLTVDEGATFAVLGSESMGRFTGSGNVTIAANQTLTTSYASASNSFAGQISGAGGLIKAGTGTLTLSGSNSFGGLMQLNEGTLLVGNANALGAGTVQVQFDEAGTRTIASAGGAGFTIANNVNIYNSVTIGQTTGGTGSLDFTGTVALGDPTATNNRNVTVNGNHTISGVITGSNSLTKLGLGTLTLSGASANTFTGGAIVSAGTLQLNKTSDLNAINGPLTVGTGATLLLSSSGNVSDSSAVTLSGGTITRASGVSEVFGSLTLTTGSFLNYGTGAIGTLAFGNYAPSALLTIQNFGEGNALKFGSDVSSFLPTGGSLSNSFFSFDNSFTYNSSTFTITAIPEPSTYLAAAGLLALFLWPARRRLLKDAKSILGLRASGRDRIEGYRNA